MSTTAPDSVATQFTNFYYQSFAANRAGLASLYRDTSMLTWEGSPYQGVKAIVEKLTSLPFTTVQHKVTTLDAQPSNPQGGLIVSVTGLLLVDDSTIALQFSQVFQLIPDGTSFYVLNDVFRLNYG